MDTLGPPNDARLSDNDITLLVDLTERVGNRTRHTEYIIVTKEELARILAMVVRTAALLLLMLLPATGHAQDLSRLKLPLLVFGAAAGADVASTLHTAALAHRYNPTHRVEQNPLVRWAEPHVGVPGTMMVGAAMEVATIWAVCKWLCDTHPTFARRLIWIGAGVHLAFASKNMIENAPFQERMRCC